MLEFTQEVGDVFGIGDNIKITITESKSGQVKLGIDAPRSVSVKREELYERDAQRESSDRY